MTALTVVVNAAFLKLYLMEPFNAGECNKGYSHNAKCLILEKQTNKRKMYICVDAGLTSDSTFWEHLDFPVNIVSKCGLITWTTGFIHNWQ